MIWCRWRLFFENTDIVIGTTPSSNSFSRHHLVIYPPAVTNKGSLNRTKQEELFKKHTLWQPKLWFCESKILAVNTSWTSVIITSLNFNITKIPKTMLGHNTRLLQTQRKLIDDLSILLLNYCVRGGGGITGNIDVYNASNRRLANPKSKLIAQKKKPSSKDCICTHLQTDLATPPIIQEQDSQHIKSMGSLFSCICIPLFQRSWSEFSSCSTHAWI